MPTDPLKVHLTQAEFVNRLLDVQDQQLQALIQIQITFEKIAFALAPQPKGKRGPKPKLRQAKTSLNSKDKS